MRLPAGASPRPHIVTPRRPCRPAGALRHAGLLALVGVLALAGCASVGPGELQQSRLAYNKTVKSSADEEMLLNIVRLRYGEAPMNVAVSTIAAQYERTLNAGVLPFFTASGADVNASFTAMLPQAGYGAAERPTFSYTPTDDQDYARKLFTPLPRSALLYLAKTTWPISTVFRLFLENLNWVPNAQTASGPTPARAPTYVAFRRGIDALESLQRRNWLVFGQDTVFDGEPLAARPAAITVQDQIEARKADLQLRRRPDGVWALGHDVDRPVLRFSPAARGSDEMRTLAEVFGIEPGLDRYAFTQEELDPFAPRGRVAGLRTFDIETRSMMQAMFYVAHGVEVPEDDLSRGIARRTLDDAGNGFDWRRVTEGLFRVHVSSQRPGGARVAVPYRGRWFWIDDADHETKATFALLGAVSRIELNDAKAEHRPVLTLPIGGH